MDLRIELALWTAGSVMLSVLGAQLAWRAQQRPASWLGRFRSGWAGNRLGYAILFLVRLAYYLGLPYAVLMRHALSPVVIGLAGTQTPDLPWWMLGRNPGDWTEAIRWAAILGVLAAATLALGWWNVSRATGAEFPSGGVLPAPSLLVAAREGIYAEIHWAFYRAAPLMFIADSYWATLAGAALVIAEWALDPAWHVGLANGSRRETVLMQLAWLALSTSMFMLARNVWLAILLHVALAWAVGEWAALLAAKRAEKALNADES